MDEITGISLWYEHFDGNVLDNVRSIQTGGYSEKMKEFYAKRGIIVTKNSRDEQTGQNFTLKVDSQMLQQAAEEAGFFVILSNRLMTAGEMISIARKRDCVEKAFKDLKSHFPA
ncbi:MAG: hypothetical protein IJU76_14710 [Desulfovibrionaceae bacterium]|nr:hypothetical protein [Desulfovibrionaceae bacterium]